MEKKLKAVILAAGKGTRLSSDLSDLPKVMRKANGKPLLSYVTDALSFLEKHDIIIVVGYKKDVIVSNFQGCSFAEQTEQRGTGHAVMAARELLCGTDSVLVCNGDMPLLRRKTYELLVDTHMKNANACTILSGTSDTPLPYGRVIRDSAGEFLKIIEQRDLTSDDRDTGELNTGVYVFDTALLLDAASKLTCDNAQGEYYITDVPGLLRERGARVGICRMDLGNEIIGVNTSEQLCEVESILKARKT